MTRKDFKLIAHSLGMKVGEAHFQYGEKAVGQSAALMAIESMAEYFGFEFKDTFEAKLEYQRAVVLSKRLAERES